jgi:predicted protein tyrosine phosphatase
MRENKRIVLNPRSPWLIWCNQTQMRRTPPKADVAVISCVEPEDDFLIPGGFLEVLKLSFHDATDRDGKTFTLFDKVNDRHFKSPRDVEIQLFTEQMAQDTLAFLKRNSDNSIMIHCRAGMSRSAAIARFAADFLAREPVGWVTPTTQFANTFVLALLNRERWK